MGPYSTIENGRFYQVKGRHAEDCDASPDGEDAALADRLEAQKDFWSYLLFEIA